MTTATRPPATRPTTSTTRPTTAARKPAPRKTATHKTETTLKAELSPVESLIVETALGEEALRLGPDGVLARIQELTRERQKLYAKTAAHPILAPTYAPRIRAVAAELEMLWELHRRQRATRRVQMERALNVSIEVEPKDERDESDFEDDEDHDERTPRRRAHPGRGAA
ncbi:MAG TPA: hypothetical protein VF116_15105 [Ktedonobacterales bacterium]